MQMDSPRLAKQVTSTNTSLKQALSKFNNQPRDEDEEVLYNLPHTLLWKDVVDLQGMVNLEISAKAKGLDTEQKVRAVWLHHMNEGAKEEVEKVKCDMMRTAEFYSREHSFLNKYSEKLKRGPSTTYTRGCLNLLFHHLVLC